MRSRRFAQVDVFSHRPTKGNGLAVIVDADGLSTDQMQDFAAWTNLAETTFLLPPTSEEADYRVRIFTPNREMPFAGHPTLGSCATWLHFGGRPKSAGKVLQECAIGLVEIDLGGPALAFVAPETTIAPLEEAALHELCRVLGLDRRQVVRSARLNNGPAWQVLELASADDVLAVDASLVQWPEYVGVSLLGAYPEGSECQFEVRNISPSSGMVEDPITGSLNSAIARWMAADGRLTSHLTMSQGTKLGREGRVFIRLSPDVPGRVTIGGHVQVIMEGAARF